MTSLTIDEQEKDLFTHDEQSPQQSESFEGTKVISHMHSISSSLASTTLPNQQQQAYRSLSSHDLISSVHVSSSNTRNNLSNNDCHSNQFDRRFTDQFLLWENEYDSRIKQMNDIKSTELNKLKVYYEVKLHDLEDNHRQLEVISGQINQENKRLKIELEHERQKNKIEQTSLEQHLKEFKNHLERKIHEIKTIHENDKQEIKQQNSRIYQDLLDETNQRLKKLENNYKYQQSTNEIIIEEMETRLKDLQSNVNNLQQIKRKLEDDKNQLMKTNEQLQIQVQELTNKQRYIDRNHTDKIQLYESELKSISLRFESTIDFLRQENDILKTKSSKTIEDLETKLLNIKENFHEIEKSFEDKLIEEKLLYHNNLKQYENDYEKKIQILRQELQEQNNKYNLSLQHKEQLQNDIRQLKHQFSIDLENKIQELNNQAHENEQILINKLKFEYEQVNLNDQEKFRENISKEIEEIKRKYEEIIKKKEETLLDEIQASIGIKRKYEIEKQQLVNQYEQYVRKLENNNEQTSEEYENRIQNLIAKTHEQVKSMEDEYEARYANQQTVINDQKKTIQTFKDEENRKKLLFEKQYKVISEQALREKSEIKTQFDTCMKNLQKNFNILTSKKEQLERKLSCLKEQHKNELLEFRLSYEKNMEGLLSNDIRLDLENTIFSLKKQVIYLQQRIALIQKEHEQYVQLYGHQPSTNS